MSKGYKVVLKSFCDGRLLSATEFINEIEYKIGVATRRPPGCGPLAVFDSILHAINYALYGELIHLVYECEYVKSRDSFLWRANGQISRGFSLPVGTRFADSVTLIKKVEYR